MLKLTFTLMAAAVVAAASLGQTARAADDIVDTAVAAGSFKTLATALKAANLVDALKGDGPFTVFAPTDDAFAKLPEGTVDSLLKPESRDTLAAILKYHVVSGSVPAEKVVELSGAQTLNGQRVDIKTSGGQVKVDNATVVKTDIRCSNGIIHVIDRVILPVQEPIPAVAQKAGKFKTLLAAANAAGLAETLSSKGPFTVFAPTDEAFSKLPEGTVESLLKPENKDKLVAILKYHVLQGRVYSDEALKANEAETLQGGTVRIRKQGNAAKVNDARLIATDIDASNGVIHVIDGVLLPSQNKVSAGEARQMIHQTVAKGAQLFNNGHHAECARLYMTTARKMVAYGEQLPQGAVASLTSALNKASHTECPTERSWTMRHGLDRAYYAMRSLD